MQVLVPFCETPALRDAVIPAKADLLRRPSKMRHGWWNVGLQAADAAPPRKELVKRSEHGQ
jgi:hypothetical protein